MRKITTALLTGSALLLFTACGGGGGGTPDNGGGTNPPPANTNKYDLRNYIDKVSLRLNMEGTISGQDTQATFDSDYIGNYDYSGTPIDIHEVTWIFNGSSVISQTGTYLGNIYGIESAERNCYIASGITPTPIPTDATVGYVSDVVPLECDDGASAEVSMKLNADGPDNAIAVATVKLYVGSQVTETKSFSKLDPNMNLLSYEFEGNNISLHSISIQQN